MSQFRIILVLFLVLGDLRTRVEARAFFIFGDSLVDNGNNNYLATSARADSPPYGIDFPTHRPTGRFSNGLNMPDIISQNMGWEFPLPYLSQELTGQKLLVGANFASAGVGILNDTGVQFANIIGIYEQLNNFAQYQQKLGEVVGKERAKQIVKDSLGLITLGGNDFVNNYYLVPYSPRSQQYTIQEYVPFLITEYNKILQKLYSLGPRRVLVTGTGPLGCVPAELALHSDNGECANEFQNAASLFNSQLMNMLNQLNKEIGSTVFITANVDQMHFNFLSNPQKYGFKNSKDACCGQGPYNGLGLCTPISNLCPNRDEYVFWDAFHPSEKANRLIVQYFFNGSTNYMHPMNLGNIMALDKMRG